MWGLNLSSRDMLAAHNIGSSRKSVYTFLCSNYDDFVKFSHDLRTQIKDMTVIEQLRVQDNFELMQSRTNDLEPDAALRSSKRSVDEKKANRGKDCSLSREAVLGSTGSEFRSSRNKSNSIDSLLDPPAHVEDAVNPLPVKNRMPLMYNQGE